MSSYKLEKALSQAKTAISVAKSRIWANLCVPVVMDGEISQSEEHLLAV